MYTTLADKASLGYKARHKKDPYIAACAAWWLLTIWCTQSDLSSKGHGNWSNMLFLPHKYLEISYISTEAL